jgi:hypothetical protein
MLATLIVLLAALGVFLALSHNSELQEGRWLKFTVSLFLVFLITRSVQSGLGLSTYFALFLFALLCTLWSPNVSHYIGGGIAHLLFDGSGEGALGGFRPDFREARSFAEEGDLNKAIELSLAELAKDPANYEGRMLLAALYHEQKLPTQAIIHLDVILNNHSATADQKRHAQAGKTQCLAQQRDLDMNTAQPASDRGC